VNRTNVHAEARRRVPAAIGASALTLFLLATAAAPVAAAPSLRSRISEGTLRIFGSPFADQITLGRAIDGRRSIDSR